MRGIEDCPDIYITYLIFELGGSKSIPYSHMLITMLMRSGSTLVNTSKVVQTYLSSATAQSLWSNDETAMGRLDRLLSCLSMCGVSHTIDYRIGAILHKMAV